MAADRHGPRVGGGDRPWRAVRGLSASNASSCVASRLATGQDKLCFNMATKFDGLVIHKLVFYGKRVSPLLLRASGRIPNV